MSGTQQYVGPNAVYPDPTQQTCLQQIIPSYAYQQFADDDNILAFVQAQNDYATQFLLWFNTLNLPIYTGGIISGALLDWVAQGLYGIMRPSVTTGSIVSLQGIDALPINVVAINSPLVSSSEATQSVNDDIFRRVITWNFYKGDGFQFSIPWLKRRVYRFINGPNGISPTISQTYEISVAVAARAYTIEVITAQVTQAALLSALIMSGACVTPFQFTFSLSASTGLVNDGGVLQLNPTQGYAMSPAGLAAGALWDDGGVIAVVPGVTPNPSAPAVYFGAVSSLDLLALGGGNLPLTNPGVGTLQLWNKGGLVCVA